MPAKLTIDDMQRIAAERGGRCLSQTYTNTMTPLTWECSAGHVWNERPTYVLHKGHWCQHCDDRRKLLTIEDMRRTAEERGGSCLSEVYTDNRTKLDWECTEKHRWSASWDSVQKGSWCGQCASNRSADSRRHSLEDMHRMAEAKGGKCLSETYIGSDQHLVWQCGEGHPPWRAKPNKIQQGRWCPECKRDRLRQNPPTPRRTLDEAQEIAAERGGRCLSEVYSKNKTKLIWQCASGHKWTAPLYAVAGLKSWCPHCARVGSSYGERVSRLIMEAMFGTMFPKVRPVWLKVNGGPGVGMELDGYADGVRLAFEYQGRQHYEQTTFHSVGQFVAQQERDALKATLCRENKVTLIAIPEFKDHRNLPGCIQEVENAALSAGVELPQTWQKPTSLRSLDDPLERVFGEGRVAELRRIAAERGGALLSDAAETADTKLLWQCAELHEWHALARSVQRGNWCRTCAGLAPLTIDEMRTIAAQRGGQCLSDIYVNTKTKLRWRCAIGHEWEAVPDSVKQGRWCPECSGNIPLTLEDMHALAVERGGQCLSAEYWNNRTKLRWRCDQEHEWEATPSDVKQGKWCLDCFNARRGKRKSGNISELQCDSVARD